MNVSTGAGPSTWRNAQGTQREDQPKEEIPSRPSTTQPRVPKELPFYQRPMSNARSREQFLRQISNFFSICKCSISTVDTQVPEEIPTSSPETKEKGTKAPKAYKGSARDYENTMKRTSANKASKARRKETPGEIRQRLAAFEQSMGDPLAQPASHEDASRPASRLTRFMARFLEAATAPPVEDAQRDFRLRPRIETLASRRLEEEAATTHHDKWIITLDAALRGLDTGIGNFESILKCIDNLPEGYNDLWAMTETQANGASGPLRAMITGLQNLSLINTGHYQDFGAQPSGLESLSQLAHDILNTDFQSSPADQRLTLRHFGTPNSYIESEEIPGARIPKQLDDTQKKMIRMAITEVRTLRDELKGKISELQEMAQQSRSGEPSGLSAGVRDPKGKGRATLPSGQHGISSGMQTESDERTPSVRSARSTSPQQPPGDDVADVARGILDAVMAAGDEVRRKHLRDLPPPEADGIFVYRR